MWLDRFNDQAITILSHNRLIPGKLKLARYAQGLIGAIGNSFTRRSGSISFLCKCLGIG